MPGLDDVTQTFYANVGPYVEMLNQAIEAAEKLAAANAAAAESMERVQQAAQQAGAAAADAAGGLKALQSGMSETTQSALVLTGAEGQLTDAMQGKNEVVAMQAYAFSVLREQMGLTWAATELLAGAESDLARQLAITAGVYDIVLRYQGQMVVYSSAASQALAIQGGQLQDLRGQLAITAGAADGFQQSEYDLIQVMAEKTASAKVQGAALEGLAVDAAGAAAAAVTVAGAEDQVAQAGQNMSIAAGFWQRWGTVIHWVVAGGAEFLAVFIPAMIAAGGAAAVMAQGIGDIYEHAMAMYDAQEATANILHQTIGEWVGFKSVLQDAQNAADPKIFELLGAGINIVKASAGGFVQEGTQVLNVLDDFAAKITGEMQGALGTQLHNLLGQGVQDLTEFGEILGNVGHAILNLAGDMPGLAHILLDFFSIISRVIEVLTSMPGIIIGVAMGLEEFWRWGGLVAGVITRVLMLLPALPAVFVAIGLAIASTAAKLVQAVVVGFANMIGQIGIWAESVGSAGADAAAAGPELLGLGGAAVIAGEEVEAAGIQMQGFAASMLAVADEITPLMGLLIVAAGVGFGVFIDKVLLAATPTEKFTASLQAATEAASNADVLSVVASNLGQLKTASLGASASLNQLDSEQQKVTTSAEGGYKAGAILTQQIGEQKQAIDTLNSAQRQQVQEYDNVLNGAAQLEKTYGTTFVGALELATQAGVKLANGITGTGSSADIARLKIANYMSGMEAMGETSTMAGRDVTLLGIDSALSATKVSTLNSAIDQFVSNVTGGTSNLGALSEAIVNIGQVSTSSAGDLSTDTSTIGLSLSGIQTALTNFGQTGSQVWQNFDSALSGSAEQLADWFRTAGAEGAISSTQMSQGMLDIVSEFTQFAQKSPEAQKELVAFAQAQGLNVTSFGQLEQKIKSTGASAEGLSNIVATTTGNMAKMNQVAQSLGSSVGTDVVNALNSAKLAASGLGTNAEALAKAFDEDHSITPQLKTDFGSLYESLLEVYGNTTQAKEAADGYAQQLGLTSGQVAILNQYLTTLKNDVNAVPSSKTITITTVGVEEGNTVALAAALGGGEATIRSFHGSVVGYQSGGMVGGAFGRDMNLAALTAGEAVLNTRAVSALGGPLGVHALNNQPSEAVLTGAGGGGGQGVINATFKIPVMLNGQQLASAVHQTQLVYDRRNANTNVQLNRPGRPG